jgi:2'-5' RNA ligase
MRVFVAVVLPDTVRQALDTHVAPLLGRSPELTWEAPERWHITLSFLGEVDDAVLEALAPRLERAASRTERCQLAIAGVGRFGNRVLYAKVAGDRARLRRLAERTTAAARRAGVDISDVKFRPHVTLARSRRGVDLVPLVEAARDLAVPEWSVGEIHVVHSILGRDRRYEIVGTHRLGRASDEDV